MEPKRYRLRTASGDGFLLGVNYPWFDYGWDFGGYPTRTDKDMNVVQATPGISDKVRTALVTNDFEEMRKSKVVVVRWFLFCDGRSGIEFRVENRVPYEPVGLRGTVIEDLRAALEVARQAHIYVVLCLLDFKWSYKAWPLDEKYPDLFGGGHGQVLLKPAWRQALLENVFMKVFLDKVVSNHPNLLAIEFMNEPELVTTDMEPRNEVAATDAIPSHKVNPNGFSDFKNFVRTVRDAVHHHMNKAFTISCLNLKFAHHWLDVLSPEAENGDFMQVHYWEKQNTKEPDAKPGGLYDTPWEKLQQLWGRKIPVVWGEFTANGPKAGYENDEGKPVNISLAQYLDRALAYKFAGAWPWAWGGKDDHGKSRNAKYSDRSGVDGFGGRSREELLTWASTKDRTPELNQGPAEPRN